MVIMALLVCCTNSLLVLTVIIITIMVSCLFVDVQITSFDQCLTKFNEYCVIHVQVDSQNVCSVRFLSASSSSLQYKNYANINVAKGVLLHVRMPSQIHSDKISK